MKKILDLGTHVLTIKTDDSPESPREWDNLGTCAFFHSRYNLGDDTNIDHNDYDSFADMEKALVRDFDAVVVLPVYMYEHSGITIKTSPFGCNWDSGQLGFIYATRADIKANYTVNKRISAKLKAQIEKQLEGEIKTLDQYVTGDVYGFELVNKETNEMDSCWGFYGDNADNGIFDDLDIEGLTFENYKEAFENAEIEYA